MGAGVKGRGCWYRHSFYYGQLVEGGDFISQAVEGGCIRSGGIGYEYGLFICGCRVKWFIGHMCPHIKDEEEEEGSK